MDWIMIVGVVVIVGVLVALIWPSRKDKETPGDRRTTTEELSEGQRRLWEQAEQAIAAHMRARGDEVGPSREHMLRVADDADAWPGLLEGKGASERQVLMAKLAAEEIREFVNEALAQHPEGPRN